MRSKAISLFRKYAALENEAYDQMKASFRPRTWFCGNGESNTANGTLTFEGY